MEPEDESQMQNRIRTGPAKNVVATCDQRDDGNRASDTGLYSIHRPQPPTPHAHGYCSCPATESMRGGQLEMEEEVRPGRVKPKPGSEGTRVPEEWSEPQKTKRSFVHPKSFFSRGTEGLRNASQRERARSRETQSTEKIQSARCHKSLQQRSYMIGVIR
jgi:hypothetical protein